MAAVELNLERGLPASIDAERVILGAILLDDHAFFEASASLVPDDFTLESHRRLYERIETLANSGRPVDIVTLTEELSKRKEVEYVGGVAYVSGLMDGLPRRPSIEQYVRIVKDKAALRRIIHTATSAIARAQEQIDSPDVIAGELETDLLDIAAGVHPSQHDTSMGKAAIVELERIYQQRKSGEEASWTTGIHTLDNVTAIFPGELIYIGARPNEGKTPLASQLIAHLVESYSLPCGFISIEMRTGALMRRYFRRYGKVYSDELRRNPKNLSDDELKRVRDAAYSFADWPVQILDDSHVTPQKVVATARKWVRRFGIKALFIDYFTKMALEGKAENYRLACNRASAMLANLAKDEDLAVVCLSQLRRIGSDAPTLSDLKETGNLEQDAHQVWLLYRPESGDQIIVAKARDGATGAVPVFFDTRSLTFRGRQ